jgi:molybdate transport system regulatory protein
MTHPRVADCGWNWKEAEMVPFKLKSRQWLVDEQDRIIMGEGRKDILETIERTGSINQTAKIMKMSYKAAWGKIKATEQYLNYRIVNTDRKKGTWLTKEGKELLEKYILLKKRCLQEENKIFSGIFGREET